MDEHCDAKSKKLKTKNQFFSLNHLLMDFFALEADKAPALARAAVLPEVAKNSGMRWETQGRGSKWMIAETQNDLVIG